MNSLCMIRLSERLRVSIFSVFALLFFFAGQGFTYAVVFLSSVTLHEASHIFFLCRYGAKIKTVSVFPFGVDILADTSRISYKKELICTLSGSLSNLLFSLISYLFLHICPSPVLLFFLVCNLFLAVINLIPLSFFDGGKALRLILYDRLEIDRAFYIYKFIDILSALAFVCLAFFVVTASGFNLSVCAIILYAAISTLSAYIKRSA